MVSLCSYKQYNFLKAKSLTRRHNSPRIPQNIARLPLEVITLIMMELDCIEVARVRRTCRLIHAASQSRQLWLRIHEKLSLDYDHPLPYAKHIAAMTTSELEKSVTDWLRVEIGWLSTRSPQRRSIGHFTDEDSALLVEGGQWLLTFNKYGRGPIYAHNLAEPSDPRIKLLDLTTPCTELQLTIQILSTFPRLEFVLALFCDVTFNGPVRLEIWKVVDSNAVHGSRLSAVLLTSFTTSLNICSRRDLRDNLFAGQVVAYQLYRISIIDWSRSCSLGLCEAAIYPKPGSVGIVKLLPDRRLVTIGPQGVCIYQHDPCSYEPLPKSSWGLLTSPIQSLELPYTELTYTVTPPHTDYVGNIRILFGTTDGLMQVSIPERLEDAQLFLSLPLPPCLSNFGRYRMVIQYHPKSATEWDAITACLHRSQQVQFNTSPSDWPTLSARGLNPCHLDEISGRIVEVDAKNDMIVVDYKV